jgi:hypothetical protein
MIHNQLTVDQDVARVHTVSSRDYPASSLRALVDRDLFSKRAKYVCNICLDHGGKLLAGTLMSDGDDTMTMIMIMIATHLNPKQDNLDYRFLCVCICCLMQVI